MKIAGISEAKNRLSALIDGLRSGSPVLIVDRGRPVARLEPIAADVPLEVDGRIARLARSGMLKLRRKAPDKKLFKTRLPRPRKGVSALAALLDERREGR